MLDEDDECTVDVHEEGDEDDDTAASLLRRFGNSDETAELNICVARC